MRIRCNAFWLQKAGNTEDEYEDAFAPGTPVEGSFDEFRCAVADGATETSFSGLWAQILADAYVEQRLTRLHAELLAPLSSQWHAAITARTAHKPLPWYAVEKLEKGAFSSLMGLCIYGD